MDYHFSNPVVSNFGPYSMQSMTTQNGWSLCMVVPIRQNAAISSFIYLLERYLLQPWVTSLVLWNNTASFVFVPIDLLLFVVIIQYCNRHSIRRYVFFILQSWTRTWFSTLLQLWLEGMKLGVLGCFSRNQITKDQQELLGIIWKLHTNTQKASPVQGRTLQPKNIPHILMGLSPGELVHVQLFGCYYSITVESLL